MNAGTPQGPWRSVNSSYGRDLSAELASPWIVAANRHETSATGYTINTEHIPNLASPHSPR
jgi:hypothetical protein